MKDENRKLRMKFEKLPEPAAKSADSAVRTAIHAVAEEVKEGGKTSVEGTASGEDQGGSTAWSLAMWVESLNLGRVVAEALLSHVNKTVTKSIPGISAAQRGQVERLMIATLCDPGEGGTSSPALLLALLSDALCLERVAETLYGSAREMMSTLHPKRSAKRAAATEARVVGAPPSTAVRMNAKFIESGAFTLQLGGPSFYFSGLSSITGPAQADRMAGLRAEHRAAADSDICFTTGNYGITTTSRIEFTLVVEPDLVKGRDEALAAAGLTAWPAEMQGSQKREVLPLDAFTRKIAEFNTRLGNHGFAPLEQAEFIAARMYTGPCFEKYNAVLRAGLDMSFFVDRRQKLCADNRYATTLATLNSSFQTLSKLQQALPVYRAPGGALPTQFWQPDELGALGGIELGCLSTTVKKEIAHEYACRSKAFVIFEIKQDLVDRGADLSWLSQYPGEGEITFPPLTSLSVVKTRIDGSVLVVELNPSLAATPTETAQVTKSKKKSFLTKVSETVLGV